MTSTRHNRKVNVGIAIPHELQAHEMLELATLAEKGGYHSIWKSEDYYYRDGISLLSALAIRTKTMKLGTCVINPYTRNLALIAMTAATLDEISRGRFILGIGSSTKVWMEDQLNIKLGNRLLAMREAVGAIRRILTGDVVRFEGKEFTLKNVRLGFKPYRRRIPIYLAAVGPKMLQLAGEIADGVILTGASSVRYVRDFAMKNLKAGAERGGRGLEELAVCCNTIFSCSEDSKKAKELTKWMVGLCLSAPEYGRLMMQESGMDEDVLIPIQRCLETGDTRSMRKYVTDEMVELFTVSGNEKECRQKLREYVAAGVDTPILFVMGNYQQTITHFVPFNDPS